MTADGNVVALCGGIGGAKLALGLADVVPADELTVIVNTGDDFEHFGLHVSPDVDTVLYTLARTVNTATGWGRAEESWRFMDAVAALGGETWFSLGDTDLATHAVRTAALRSGARLTEVTRELARQLGVGAAVLPASDDRVATYLDTDEGTLTFQRYFVGRRCEPAVRAIRFAGAQCARPTKEVVAALSDAAAVVVCPSNPYLSIDPMLALPGFADLVRSVRAPRVAVSPLVGGTSVKGPLAKLMGELGRRLSHHTIAQHYQRLVDVLMVDEQPQGCTAGTVEFVEAPTMMRTDEDKRTLARAVLDVARARRRVTA